jgi:hypothetical protein
MDIDNKGALDQKEFAAALRQPSTPVEQFVETLPISGMLASSLAIPGAADPLKELCNLEPSRLKAVLEAFSSSLHRLLEKELGSLKDLLDSKEAKEQVDADGSGSKCAVFVMNAGSVKAYFEGIYEVPGAYLEQSGPAEMELSSGRVVTVLPVRANASGKALTVEVPPDGVVSAHTRARVNFEFVVPSRSHQSAVCLPEAHARQRLRASPSPCPN